MKDLKNTKKISDELIMKIKYYYDIYNSSRKVAKELNVGRTTVLKYIKDDKKQKKNNSKNVIEWRKRKKIELIEYKGGCCEVCGYNKTIRSLDFHHKDPKYKDFGISGKSYSFERLKKEVDKCILVCSNCHGEIHEEIDINGYSDIINNIK
ncbi:HNH endonuclease [bacterium]|jgi:hypothetical protein|nr:HNH endonuclease [bacterium]